jgi:hypothetical protein
VTLGARAVRLALAVGAVGLIWGQWFACVLVSQRL